jgi:hypothetical protein
LVAAAGLVLIVAVVQGESSVGHGFAHPKYATMERGGLGLERHGPILWLGWLFGVLQIAIFVVCIALGSVRRGRTGGMSWVLTIGGLLYVGVFSVMFLAYFGSLEADPTLMGSFPEATALMLYALWPVPTYFVIVYVTMFDRWIFTADDSARFEALVAASRERRKGGD